VVGNIQQKKKKKKQDTNEQEEIFTKAIIVVAIETTNKQIQQTIHFNMGIIIIIISFKMGKISYFSSQK